MTLTAEGNLGLGTTSPLNLSTFKSFVVKGTSAGLVGVSSDAGTAFGRIYNSNGNRIVVGASTAHPLAFDTNDIERCRIDSSGNFLVGTTSGLSHVIAKGTGTNDLVLNVSGLNHGSAQFYTGSGTQGAATATCVNIPSVASSGRSINAGGTVNVGGLDYAEYMTKAGNFTVAKGDVVGINAQGRLTNVFADAVSFVVKSTNPSYVGGDTWGVGFDDDAEGLEVARQAVDRIAFSGQVPVNVTGATAGQYIIPVNNNGAIKGVAKNEADLTMSEYIKAVGKVITIESDGRARIIVKVA